MSDLKLLKALNDEFGVSIRKLERINEGYFSEVYSAHTDTGEIVIKISRDRNPYPKEIWGYKKFQKLSIKVPKILGYKENPTFINAPTLILEKLPGKSLYEVNLTKEEEETIFKEMGKILKKVHTIQVKGFGSLNVLGDEVQGESDSWRDYLIFHDALDSLSYLQEKELVSKDEYKKIIQNYQELLEIELDSASFVYSDFHGSHIFIDQGEITGVIDLGGAVGGDPLYDIAISLYYQTPTQQKSFKEGYGEGANHPNVIKYLLYVASFKVVWRHKNGFQESTNEGLEVLKQMIL